MFFALPLNDHPNPKGLPIVTYLLMVINIGIYLLLTLPLESAAIDLQNPATLDIVKRMQHDFGVTTYQLIRATSQYDILVRQFGFTPRYPALLPLLTSMFLHSGFWHLAGNMLFLHIFGDNVEQRLGAFRYLLVYLLTGVAGTLVFSMFSLGSPIPLIGASGAISGVLGLYFVWFPRNKVRVLTVVIWFIQVVTIPARYLLGFYVVVQNILPFVLADVLGDGGNVAHGAHIGGFLAGIIIASKWFKKQQP